MIRFVAPIVAALLALITPPTCEAGPYEPTWESLANVNEAPEWFRDAKVGIYFHWGVYSLPAFGSEWYPRQMYLPGQPEYQHHRETHGDPAEFDYAKFVPGFGAERFDAEDWAKLFVRAGARFAGPVCEHHDGFSMWDSALTPWNAADMGPKRDITGELEKAIRAHDMKFVATFHHARNSLWQPQPGRWTGHYEGVLSHYPTLLEDPQRAILYGYIPREEFVQMWLNKLREVIDHYEPDLMWFDSWLDEIPESTRREYLAYYYNAAAGWGREVVVTRKQDDLPMSCSLVDFEKGRAAGLTENVWLTDDTISQGSWSWTRDLTIKDADEVIDTLIDIVSKNGQLLLNISPKADGTIPQDQRDVLLALGDWLQANGEAIYDTRPWLTFGEGPTRMDRGGHFVGSIRYGEKDIRYTQSKDEHTLYATVLGNPSGPVTLRSVQVRSAAPHATVTRLADGASIAFSVNGDGQPVLQTQTSPHPTAGQAGAYRLVGMEPGLHPDAALLLGESVVLTAEQATLLGTGIRTESQVADRVNLGYWDDPSDRVHWLLPVRKPGTYRFLLEYAGTTDTRIALGTEGQVLTQTLPATGSWNRPDQVSLGEITFDQAAVYHLVLSAADADSWRAVNLWELQAIRLP